LHLSELERAALHEYLGLLLDADEPGAFLGSLRRIAERKAHSFTRGKIDADECGEWLALADALIQVEQKLHAAASAKT
jgi:hypothetical protein